jgi:hypothetical protein
LAKKGIMVWIFSTMTFVAILHLAEAVSVLFFDGQTVLLQQYPLVGEELQRMNPTLYLAASASATFFLWGITCNVAFDSPVESFLNKLLSDAKRESAVEVQAVEKKSELLDLMNEAVLTNGQLLAETKDLVCNIRAEVKEIRPLRESIERIRFEVSFLKKEIKKFEEMKYLKNVQTVESSHYQNVGSVTLDGR